MDKISIVVPIYNSSLFLSRCVDSLITQTYKNIEIILVNDGSKDNSLEICRKYEQVDSRIKVFDKPNSGVGSTRNYGLRQCTGKYICFVDSDDYVSSKYCEILMRNLANQSADLSIVSLALNECEPIEGRIEYVDKNDAYYQVLFDNSFFGYPVNKLYKKDIIAILGDKPFPENLYWGEDLIFNINYLINCDRIVKQDIILYYYIQNDDSCTNKKTINDRTITLLDSCKRVIDIYSKLCKDKVDYAWLFYLHNISFINKYSKTKEQNKLIKFEAKKAIKNINNSDILSYKIKKKYIFEYKHPKIFNIINNIFVKIKK